MKNLSVALIIGILLSKPGISQSVKDSIIPKKNEISIDLIPAIKLYSNLNSNVTNYRETIQYKRQLNKHLFLRVGATVTKEGSKRKYSNITVAYADSVHDAVNYEEHGHKLQLQLNAGIEYRWGKGRVKQFTGMDMGYLHTETINSLYRSLVLKYSNYDPNTLGGTLNPGSVYDNKTVIYSYSSKQSGICFTPFYGVQYHFSNRFFFSMQLGFQLQLLQSVNKPIVSNPLYYYSNKTYEFNAGTGGILNNFSIAYRF